MQRESCIPSSHPTAPLSAHPPWWSSVWPSCCGKTLFVPFGTAPPPRRGPVGPRRPPLAVPSKNVRAAIARIPGSMRLSDSAQRTACRGVHCVCWSALTDVVVLTYVSRPSAALSLLPSLASARWHHAEQAESPAKISNAWEKQQQKVCTPLRRCFCPHSTDHTAARLGEEDMQNWKCFHFLPNALHPQPPFDPPPPPPRVLPRSQAFTAWVNSQLRVRQLAVKDIEKDLSDGRMLCQVGPRGTHTLSSSASLLQALRHSLAHSFTLAPSDLFSLSGTLVLTGQVISCVQSPARPLI